MSPLPALLRSLAAAALVVAVGGCGLFKHDEEASAIVNSRALGKPVGEFLDRYGRATSRTEVGDNTAIYNWMSDRGMTRPGPEGQDVDADAERPDLGGRFVDPASDARAVQRQRERQAADAGTDDGDLVARTRCAKLGHDRERAYGAAKISPQRDGPLVPCAS